MTKLVIGLLGAAVLATGGYAAATGVDSDPVSTISLPHATDGTTGTTTTATTGATTTDDAAEISGPCDEAEHRNDPRCTGTATRGDDDDSGPGRAAEDDRDEDGSSRGRGGDEDNDDHDSRGGDDDRSGSNSGKG